MEEQQQTDYSSVPIETAKEILRLGETELHSMLNLDIAATQRATTLCGIFSTAAIASIGGGAAAYDLAWMEAMYAALTSAAFLFLGSVFCIRALLPKSVYVPGFPPGSLLSSEALHGSLADTLINIAKQYQDDIDANDRSSKKKATQIKIGAALGVTAPAAGVLTYFFTGGFG